MAKLNTLQKNNKKLRVVSEPIKFITQDIKKLAVQMSVLMTIKKGCGIAAPQVGHNIRLIIIKDKKKS